LDANGTENSFKATEFPYTTSMLKSFSKMDTPMFAPVHAKNFGRKLRLSNRVLVET